MRWAGHIARMGEKRNSYRILLLLFTAIGFASGGSSPTLVEKIK
jgi:hypothetical protein